MCQAYCRLILILVYNFKLSGFVTMFLSQRVETTSFIHSYVIGSTGVVLPLTSSYSCRYQPTANRP